MFQSHQHHHHHRKRQKKENCTREEKESELEDHAFEREINVDNNIVTSFMVDDKSIGTIMNTYLPGQVIIKHPQTVTTEKNL
jgi:hypothetical protein